MTAIPTIGARTPQQVADAVAAVAAVAVALTPAEVAALAVAVPAEAVVGTRYPAPMMAHLDRERGPTRSRG